MYVAIELVVLCDGPQECGELGGLLRGERAEDLGLMFFGELAELAEDCVASGC